MPEGMQMKTNAKNSLTTEKQERTSPPPPRWCFVFSGRVGSSPPVVRRLILLGRPVSDVTLTSS